MLLDQASLMLAIGFSGAALGVTLFIAWLSARNELFLFRLVVGVLFLVLGAAVFSTYRESYTVARHFAGFALLLVGFGIAWNSARQFRTGSAPLAPMFAWTFAAVAACGVPFGLGLDGLGAIVANIASAALLFATAAEYWRSRAEAPVPILLTSVLYAVTATSFSLCALALLLDGDLALAGAPDNWAEEINAVVAIFTLTGIGALSLSLHLSRQARLHKSAAMTDPLTGLLNRRALFDRFGSESLAGPVAVLLADLDHFKLINDKHGHAAGDDVLRQFAATMRQLVGSQGVPARLGGEEFAVVLPGAGAVEAETLGECIRAAFAAKGLETLAGPLACTVSIGVAVCDGPGEGFEVLLSQADDALYAAKRDGRNRICVHNLQLVA
ncbi:GGDEF domain-containing protein [Devosia nitrariae]|uniref:diguanylate cyclase n=1 Tax=Devosia nitrariae TaxID=2071872 RepID=A0ABQ5W2V9_9HYPH|nr:GGDEF domain-containing protein [Devosia nitrariae]GLQ54149.1 GGDEF domain-containing protein [Devosia nitrariae]